MNAVQKRVTGDAANSNKCMFKLLAPCSESGSLMSEGSCRRVVVTINGLSKTRCAVNGLMDAIEGSGGRSDIRLLDSMRNFTELHSKEIQPGIGIVQCNASTKGPVTGQDVSEKDTSSSLQVVEQEVEKLLTANWVLKE